MCRLKRAQILEKQLDLDLIKSLDCDDNGVDKLEFVLGMLMKLELITWSEVKPFLTMFDKFDVDGSGVLDKTDLEMMVRATHDLVHYKVPKQSPSRMGTQPLPSLEAAASAGELGQPTLSSHPSLKLMTLGSHIKKTVTTYLQPSAIEQAIRNAGLSVDGQPASQSPKSIAAKLGSFRRQLMEVSMPRRSTVQDDSTVDEGTAKPAPPSRSPSGKLSRSPSGEPEAHSQDSGKLSPSDGFDHMMRTIKKERRSSAPSILKGDSKGDSLHPLEFTHSSC